MTEIIPAIIPENFEDLEEKLGLVVGRVPLVHVDVENGTLTPRSSWPYAGEMTSFLRITEEAEGFPFWEDVSFEAHLMVKHPEEIIEDWIKAGAERLIVHLEAFESDEEVSHFLSLIKNRFTEESLYLGIEAGLAVNINTPIESLFPHVLEADFIHMMSIKKIGSQGESFDRTIFERIEALKEHFPDTIISVDGGVNLEVAEELKDAGVARIIVGSAIFGSEDPEDALYDFLGPDNS
jgi:ribulose-phosphate 3-epimerase